jgi:hypothetical protein
VHSEKDYIVFDYLATVDDFEGSEYQRCECNRIKGFEFWYQLEISKIYEEYGRTFSQCESLASYEILSREIIPAKSIFGKPEIRYKIKVSRKQLGI